MAICSPTGEWASGVVEGRLNVFPCPSEGSEFPLATEHVGSRRFLVEASASKDVGAFFVWQYSSGKEVYLWGVTRHTLRDILLASFCDVVENLYICNVKVESYGCT